eukprot:8527100-Alexandrium_andersonii.AAC.1
MGSAALGRSNLSSPGELSRDNGWAWRAQNFWQHRLPGRFRRGGDAGLAADSTPSRTPPAPLSRGT